MKQEIEKPQIEDDETIENKEEKIEELTVKYRAHVQDIGWQEYVENGQEAGTTGKKFKSRSIKYRTNK